MEVFTYVQKFTGRRLLTVVICRWKATGLGGSQRDFFILH